MLLNYPLNQINNFKTNTGHNIVSKTLLFFKIEKKTVFLSN